MVGFLNVITHILNALIQAMTDKQPIIVKFIDGDGFDMGGLNYDELYVNLWVYDHNRNEYRRTHVTYTTRKDMARTIRLHILGHINSHHAQCIIKLNGEEVKRISA